MNNKYMSEEFWVDGRCYVIEVKRKRDSGDKYMIIKESGYDDDQHRPLIVFEQQMQHFMRLIDNAFMMVMNDVKPVTYQKPAPGKISVPTEKPPNVGAKWTAELDQELQVRYEQGHSAKELANHFGRNVGGIRSRLQKLGLM